MWCWDVWSHRNPIDNIIRFLSDSSGVFHVTCYHVVLSIFIYLCCFGWFNLMCIILLSHPEHNHLCGATRCCWSDCIVVSYQRLAVSTRLLFPLIETILRRRSAIIMWVFFFFFKPWEFFSFNEVQQSQHKSNCRDGWLIWGSKRVGNWLK